MERPNATGLVVPELSMPSLSTASVDDLPSVPLPVAAPAPSSSRQPAEHADNPAASDAVSGESSALASAGAGPSATASAKPAAAAVPDIHLAAAPTAGDVTEQESAQQSVPLDFPPISPDESSAADLVFPSEPPARTQEIDAAHARAYATATPRPTGAAAADRPPQIPLAPVKRMQARFNPLADGMVYLVVFLGGCVGTAMRYGLSLLLPRPLAEQGFWSSFHLATFLANMVACFLFAGLTQYVSQASWWPRRMRQLMSRGVGMGMCGGFSTLSAMVIEELASIRGSQIGGFAFYMLASFIGGLLVAVAGAKLGQLLASRGVRETTDKAEADGSVPVPAGAAPQGDYGQPLPAGAAADAEAASRAKAARGNDGLTAFPAMPGTVPAIEPEPVTDELPLVENPVQGEPAVDPQAEAAS